MVKRALSFKYKILAGKIISRKLLFKNKLNTPQSEKLFNNLENIKGNIT